MEKQVAVRNHPGALNMGARQNVRESMARKPKPPSALYLSLIKL
jgi:hypothetical protein